MLNTNCLKRPTTKTTATATTKATSFSLQEKLNWLEYQMGALHPLLKEFSEEVGGCSAPALMGLNTSEFKSLLERFYENGYGDGLVADEGEVTGIALPPIPRKWVGGLPRKILNWAVGEGYSNGMLDQ